MTSISTWEYILTINGFLTIQKGGAKTIGHGDEIIIRHLRFIQIDNTIVEVDI